MRILITAGGTGGGVYPALAIVEALQILEPAAEFLWVGSASGPERGIVEREGLPFEAVPGGPVVGVGARAVISAARIAAGTVRARRLIARFRPAGLLSTGGWPTIPATLAAWGRCPITIALPDVEPGAAIRAMSRLAAQVAVTVEASSAYFRPGLATVTGYPVRRALLQAAGCGPLGEPAAGEATSREAARTRLGLQPDLPTLLVVGGSKGARSLNEAVLAHLPALLADCQILHISGTLGWEANRARAAQIAAGLPEALRGRYHLREYLHGKDMALALAAADLAVARAGASTLGEFPLFGLPAILVPYPHAWRYQKTNADALAGQGAAIRLEDGRLMTDLAPQVQALIRDGDARARMAAAARALARPDAAARIAAMLTQGRPTR